MTRLPATVPPLPGEAVDGYLDRASAVLLVPVSLLLEGVDLPGGAVAPHPCWLPTATRAGLAGRLGLTGAEIDTMHLSGAMPAHYRALAGAARAGDVTRAAKDLWFSAAGSRYCPHCLAATGVWRLHWRLPWAVACTIHARVLADTCPGCRRPPRSTRHGTSAHRYRLVSVRDPAVCHNQPANPGIGRSAPECGTDLAGTTTPPASRFLLDLQQQFDTILAGRGAAVAGMDLPAAEALQGWRELLVLDAHLHRRPPPTSITDPPTAATPTGAARPWLTPPCSVRATVAALTRVAPIAAAASPARAADLLRERLAPAVDANWFRDRLPAGPVLSPVIALALARHGRVSTQLRRARQQTLPLYNYTVADIPRPIPEDWLPAVLRDRTGAPSAAMLDTVLALAVARIIEGDWSDAARALDLPQDKARGWSGYVINRLNPEQRQAFVDTVLQIAGRVGS